jgi:hypothetical protein
MGIGAGPGRRRSQALTPTRTISVDSTWIGVDIDACR